MGKIMIRMGKTFYNHIEIVCVTCLNILTMGVQMGTMKSLGRTLALLAQIKGSIIKIIRSHANNQITERNSAKNEYPKFLKIQDLPQESLGFACADSQYENV